jgi:hypothetical protein
MNRRGNGYTALLIFLVGVIILLYVLFLPPGTREILLR